MKEKTIKERIYDHVHVSVRTMDIFIGVMGGTVCGGCGDGDAE